MDLIEKMAPDGWKFNSADFSLQAADHGPTGWVQLVRDLSGKRDWHDRIKAAISAGPNGESRWVDLDAVDDEYPLYVTGEGFTLEEALADAWKQAIALKPIKKSKLNYNN